MIYHIVKAGTDRTDITAACPHFLDYRLSAGSGSAAMSFSGQLSDVDVLIASRECGLTRAELTDRLKQQIDYTLVDGDTSITLSLIATRVKPKSRLVHNDQLDVDCVSQGYNALSGGVDETVRNFLLSFYWPADLSAVGGMTIDPSRPRITPEPGPYFRDWPGDRVVAGDAVLVDEFALDEDGAAAGTKLFDFSTAVSAPSTDGVRLGYIDGSLGSAGKTVALVPGYAFRGPDWENVSDYSNVTRPGLVDTDGAAVEADYNPPRAFYGQYQIRSTAYWIGRCDKDSDWDAGDDELEYGWFQQAQAIGPVRPQADSEQFKQFLATYGGRTTYLFDPEGASDNRDRLFIGKSWPEVISTDIATHPHWYFVADSAGRSSENYGPPDYNRALYLPVKTRVTLEWSSGGAVSNAEQKPPVIAYRVERPELRADDFGFVDGVHVGGYRDAPQAVDISDSGEAILAPGWYAIGAVGTPVRFDRRHHPGFSAWGTGSGLMNERQNKVVPFTLTLEPLEPAYIGRVLKDGTDLYCLHHTYNDNDWSYRADYTGDYSVYKYDGSTFSESVAGAAMICKSGGQVYTIVNTLGKDYGTWRYPQGVYQRRGVIKVVGSRTKWVDPYYTAGTDNQISILENGDDDVELTGAMDDGAGGLLLMVRVSTARLEKLDCEIRRVDWSEGLSGEGAGVKVVGDWTARLEAGDRLRLFVPRYKRRYKSAPGIYTDWYEQDYYSYPITHNVRQVVFDDDENRSWIELDPPPDHSSAVSTADVDIQPMAIQFWDALAQRVGYHQVSGDARPQLWIEKERPEPKCQVWHISEGELESAGETAAYTVLDTATEEVETTIEFSWDSSAQAYTATLEHNVDTDTISLDLTYAINLIDGKYQLVTPRRAEAVDISYTAYSPLPYQPFVDYVYQGGKLYQYDGGLTRVYSDHGLPAAPLCGDAAEISTGIYAAPVRWENSTRMIVLDTLKPNYGAALAPIELDSGSSWRDLIERYRGIGLICNRNTYTLHYPKNAAVIPLPELAESDVIDYWQDTHWADNTTTPSVSYAHGTVPASLSVTAQSVETTAVNAADARAYRNTVGRLFTETAPRLNLTARLNSQTLALADRLGYTISIPSDYGGPTATLLEVSIDPTAGTIHYRMKA